MARPSRQPAPCLQAADSLTGRPNLLPGRPAWHLQVRCFRARRPLCTLLDPARQFARVGRQCGLGCNGGLCECRGEPKDSKELGEEEGRNSQILRPNQGSAWRQSRSRPVSRVKDPMEFLRMEPLTTCKCHRSEQLEDPSRWAVIPVSVARLASPRVLELEEC